ncbi:hypothetical protein WA158_004070 [Blastocystis sp. Blastoise]
MTFTRFVEVGRVVYINYGTLFGRLATIVDIIDENKVLVDGPYKFTGVKRQIVSRVFLTKIVCKITRGARTGEVKEQWTETAWAKKLAARKEKANRNDFQRFVAMIEKRKARRVTKA